MKISKEAIEALEHYEAFSAKPYKCPAGVWTIGFGSTRIGRNRVTKNTPEVTREEAFKIKEQYFNDSVYPHLKGLTLSQNRFDALCLFIYNVGSRAFNNSTLKAIVKDNNNKLISKPQLKLIADSWIQWSKATVNGEKKALNGLLRRRRWEFLYFLDGSNSYYIQEPEDYNDYQFKCGKDVYDRINRHKHLAGQ